LGKLSDQGRPFLGPRVSFASAYPTVTRAVVRFTETDFGNDPKTRLHDFADGPRATCGNPRCQRGGYDFGWLLSEMVREGLENKAVEMSCEGDEGSPKGKRKGAGCLMSMKGTITVDYKKPSKEASDPSVDEPTRD
jgi:hypothetical protein